MQLEIVIAVVILLVLVFLASVDMAFSHLSDVSLRRLAADAEEEHQDGSASFLREIVDNRPRFRFLLSSSIQILLICFTVLLTLIILDLTDNRAQLILLALFLGLVLTVLVRQVLPGLQLGAEIVHQSADTRSGHASAQLGAGLRYDISDRTHFLAYAGPGLQNPSATGQYSWYTSVLFTF